MRALVFLLLLIPGPWLAAEESSGRQVEFGLKVAQKGLWQEARFRFERAVALELKPGDIYIQQNYDLFREADDKRNRKSRKKKAQP